MEGPAVRTFTKIFSFALQRQVRRFNKNDKEDKTGTRAPKCQY